MFITFTQFTSKLTKNGLRLLPWSTSNECRPHRSDASSHERCKPRRPVVAKGLPPDHTSSHRLFASAKKLAWSCGLQRDLVLHVFYLTSKTSKGVTFSYSLGQVSQVDQEFIRVSLFQSTPIIQTCHNSWQGDLFCRLLSKRYSVELSIAQLQKPWP